MKCIWCNKVIEQHSIEHILPESLECPPNFILKEGVCRSCNNALAHIDQAFLHDFEIITFMLGISRKDSRPPSVSTWAGIYGRYAKDGPELHINIGSKDEYIPENGRTLKPVNRSRKIRVKNLRISDNMFKITFDHNFGDNPKFHRALYKIALGSMAYFYGIDYVLQAQFDPIREFVRFGIGNFRGVIVNIEKPPLHRFVAPQENFQKRILVNYFTIFGITFDVSLPLG